MAKQKTKKVEYTLKPRFEKVTIPKTENGIFYHEIIDRSDFNDDHIKQIMEFWDSLASNPKNNFDKESAIDTIFIRTELFSEVEKVEETFKSE